MWVGGPRRPRPQAGRLLDRPLQPPLLKASSTPGQIRRKRRVEGCAGAVGGGAARSATKERAWAASRGRWLLHTPMDSHGNQKMQFHTKTEPSSGSVALTEVVASGRRAP